MRKNPEKKLRGHKKDSKYEKESSTNIALVANAVSDGFNWVANKIRSNSESSTQESENEISESEKLEQEIRARAEKRRLRMEQEEMEERERREEHELQLTEAENRREKERIEFDLAYEDSTRVAEQQRSRMEQENAKQLEEQKTRLKLESKKELEILEAQQKHKNQKLLETLNEKKEDRLRSAELLNQELERIRDETQQKIENYAREQEETRARKAREEAELEAKLQKMKAENQEARERQKRSWEDRLKTMKEQYDYMMKVMAHRQWTMTMERNFDSRLNFYRSSGKTIQRNFERFTHLLITYQENLRRVESLDQTRLRPVTMQAEELRNVVQKQKEVLIAEISNLESMHKEAGWSFLNYIRESLEDVLCGCDNFLGELDRNYLVHLNLDHIKTGEALRQMNLLYNQLSRSCSQIPTMDSLKNKHGKKGGKAEEGKEEEGSSSSQKKEEYQTDDGHVFFIEEPED